MSSAQSSEPSVREPPYPSPVQTYHRTTYPSISPLLPSLSCAGKHVIITGGGSGIGRACAHSFAAAGARIISLIGRNDDSLKATSELIKRDYPEVVVWDWRVDITKEKNVVSMARDIGRWDMLINSAGYLPSNCQIVNTNVEDWWQGFEVRTVWLTR
jgi:NAD(P)-dependent dehydrogenase (short-subunit alcohol dehydrogenase family)